VQIHFLIFSADTAGAALHDFSGFMASVCQLRPESRGFVQIRSNDASIPPAIAPRYLTGRNDRDTVIEGMKLMRRIMNEPQMRSYIEKEFAPGDSCLSDADLLAFARQTATTVYHPTSTCRMGSDPTAVVDERLRVRGIERLRIIDASIMPTLASGNTNAAAVMIGEKGSDMVLQDATAAVPLAVSA
jgi:choline dehydrogenase